MPGRLWQMKRGRRTSKTVSHYGFISVMMFATTSNRVVRVVCCWCPLNVTQAAVPDSVRPISSLTSAMASGDEHAVAEFYRCYFDLLLNEARRVTKRDEAFCLDVVQEAVMKVVRCVRRVESGSEFAAWLRLVIRTTAYDLLRSEARRRNREAVAALHEVEVSPTSAVRSQRFFCWTEKR